MVLYSTKAIWLRLFPLSFCFPNRPKYVVINPKNVLLCLANKYLPHINVLFSVGKLFFDHKKMRKRFKKNLALGGTIVRKGLNAPPTQRIYNKPGISGCKICSWLGIWAATKLQPSYDISRTVELILLLSKVNASRNLTPVEWDAVESSEKPLANAPCCLELRWVLELFYISFDVELYNDITSSANPLRLRASIIREG